jgi:molybdopterin/thiamine biosynthesis adenylyltransferase
MNAGRFERQAPIEGWRQESLAKATAVIVGAGALGNEMAKNLALAGVGRFVLCDDDVVAESNLSRTVAFGPHDVGRAKVDVVATAIARWNPAAKVDVRRARHLSGVGLGELADAQIVVSCLDSRKSRLDLLERCARVDAPLVDGGTGPWSGEVRLRTDLDHGCYSCTLSAVDRSVSDVPRSCLEIDEPGPAQASIATTALVGSWMTVAALRTIFQLPVPYRLLRIDAAGGTTTPVALRRDPGCPNHDALPVPERLPEISVRSLVRELLAALPDGSDVRTWTPIRVRRRCLRCRAPLADSSGSGRPATCDACGARTRHRESTLLAEAAPDAVLAELGIAPEEILPVVSAKGTLWVRLGQ